jgi:hypothetical protein
MVKIKSKISLISLILFVIIMPTVNAAVPPEIYLYEDEPVVWKQTVERPSETSIKYLKLNVDTITDGVDSTDIDYSVKSATQSDYESNGIDSSTWTNYITSKSITMKSVLINSSFQGYFNEYDSSGVDIYLVEDEEQFNTINRIYGDLYTTYGFIILGAALAGYDWADTTINNKEAVCTGSGNRLINHNLKWTSDNYNNTEGKWRNATFTNDGQLLYCKEANVLYNVNANITLSLISWNSSLSSYQTEVDSRKLTMEIMYPSELVSDAPSLEDIPGFNTLMIIGIIAIGCLLIAKKKRIL